MRARHIPRRSCVGCRAVREQRDLLRVVRDESGALQLDPQRRLAGRGAYLCPRRECARRSLKQKSLERALRGPVTPAGGAALEAAMAPYLQEE